MGYSDQKFYSRPLGYVAIADMGTATATGTASNSLAQPTASPLPAFARRTAIGNIQVLVIAAPNASATVQVLSFLNGTNTFATVTVTTATASQVLSAVMTASNATFAAGGQPTYNLIGTFTASGGTGGKYEILFEQQELPS
jgi:hypothetical protein